MAIKLTFEVIPEEVNDRLRVTAQGFETAITREVSPELGKIGPEELEMMAGIFVPMFEEKMKARITERIESEYDDDKSPEACKRKLNNIINFRNQFGQRVPPFMPPEKNA